MRRRSKIIVFVIFICVLLILPTMYLYYNENDSDDILLSEISNDTSNRTNLLRGGWFTEKDGVRILFLNGTNYMMGYQYGYFLKEEIEQIYGCMLHFFENRGCSYDEFMDVWNLMKDNIPRDYIEEMEGMANGSNVSWEKIVILNTLPAILNLEMCSGMSAWGSATKNGEVIHFRSLDGSMKMIDELSGKSAQELQVIVLRNPENGFRSISFSFIGDVGSWGGFNEKGIAVGEVSCSSDDTTFAGINIAFRMRMVQDYADNLDDAIMILTSNRDCGWNLFVSDGNSKRGVVIEETAHHVYQGDWDDPVESTRPFYAIENVVRRTNFFIHPDIAATQRQHYNPRGLLGLFRFIFKHDIYFFEWQHYRAFSKAINKYHGSLDFDTTMDMVRDVYSGKTTLIFRILQKKGYKTDLQQWVANPRTGDFSISFASPDTCAHENPVHYFNFYDLIEHKI